MDTQLRAELNDLFRKFPGVHCSQTSRNRMMNTLITFNITLTCKRLFIGFKSMLFHSKKVLLLPSTWPGGEYTWALI